MANVDISKLRWNILASTKIDMSVMHIILQGHVLQKHKNARTHTVQTLPSLHELHSRPYGSKIWDLKYKDTTECIVCNVSGLICPSIRVRSSIGGVHPSVCPSVCPSIVCPRIVTRAEIEIMTGGPGSAIRAADQARKNNLCLTYMPSCNTDIYVNLYIFRRTKVKVHVVAACDRLSSYIRVSTIVVVKECIIDMNNYGLTYKLNLIDYV
jgi:hypothetical protein